MDPIVPPSSARRRGTWLAVGLLAVAALAAYRNTFRAPFVLDDGDAVTENATIRHLWPPWASLAPPAGGATVSGRPLLNFSFALNYAISGEGVWSYHAFNLVLHLLAACALLGIVRRTLDGRLLRPRFGAAQLPAAAAVAGLWLLHPLQTESVTYVSQRAESLAGLFYLLTLYGFIRSVSSPRPRLWQAATVAACLAGVGTKEVAATAPLLVFLYDGTFVAGSFGGAWRSRRRLHLSLAATWVPLAVLVAGTGWNRGGTAGFDVGVAPWAYWLTQFEALARYLRLAFWPHPLVFEYGTFWAGFRSAAPFAVIVLPLAAATAAGLRRRSAPGFLGAWFFVILAPTSVVPGTNQMIVEHRMYLPLAAVVALAVTGLYALLGRRSLALWPVLGLGLGWATFRRNETYRSAIALWRDTAAKAPGNPRARYNLGIAYSEQGRYKEAVDEDEAALRLAVGWPATEEAPAIQNKLGFDLAELGRMPEAVAHYEQALRLKPDYALAHLNLARALARLGRGAEAVPHYEAALRLKVGGAQAEEELADALMRADRVDEALPHCRAVVRLMPGWAPGFNNLAYALLLTGGVDEAIADYRQAVRLDPGYAAAWMGLGYALVQAGRPAEAVSPSSLAVKLQPLSADARNTLGIALAQSGRTSEAIDCLEQALRLDPAAADVHNNLGNALDAAGRRAEAAAQYEEALRLDPGYAPARRNLADERRHAGREPGAGRVRGSSPRTPPR